MAWDLTTWFLVAGGLIFVISVVGGLGLLLIFPKKHRNDEK